VVAAAARGVALRAAFAVLAAFWAIVAWDFLWTRFAPINWIAASFAWGFALQSLLLLAAALTAGWRPAASRRRRLIAAALAAWALLLHPLRAWADGRPWQQAEIVGLAPDPTAIITLALLLMLDPARGPRGLRRALWILPVGWCALSAMTLWTMGAAQGWVMAGAIVLAGVAAARWR
jgi:hypothetical protein